MGMSRGIVGSRNKKYAVNDEKKSIAQISTKTPSATEYITSSESSYTKSHPFKRKSDQAILEPSTKFAYQKPAEVYTSTLSEDSFELEKHELVSPAKAAKKTLPIVETKPVSKKNVLLTPFMKVTSPAEVSGLTPKSELAPMIDPILKKMKISYNRRLAKYQRDPKITAILKDIHQWREWYIWTMVKNEKPINSPDKFTETEIDTMPHAKMLDQYIANVMVTLENLMEFFSKIKFYNQLSDQLKQNLVKRHSMMAIFIAYIPSWQAAPVKDGEKYDYTSETVVMGGCKRDFNFYAQIWTTPHTKRAFKFLRTWAKILGEDTRLLLLLMIYMIFDNPDSFYSNEQERILCNRMQAHIRVCIKILCHTIRKPFQLFEFWFNYDSIVADRQYHMEHVMNHYNEQNANYPLYNEMIDQIFKYGGSELFC